MNGKQAITAAVATALFAVVVAVPTDLIDTPVFSREIAPTSWSWPALAVSSLLAGVLVSTYVGGGADDGPGRRSGMAGGLLTFFAVGCPVCNKLVLVALGSAGALTWFEPVQPLLQVAAIGLLAWALHQRLVERRACAVPTASFRSIDG